MRVGVVAEEMLDAGTRRRESDAQPERVRRDELDALENGRVPFGEVPARCQRPRAREEELDALLGGRIVGEQPERASEPGCGTRRGTMRRRFAGLAERCDGGCVALACCALDVMSAAGCAHPARGQSAGASLVCAEPPAGRRRLIDRPTHERMSEAEPARHVGLPNQIEPQELVDGVERRGRRTRRRRRRELGVEGVSGHCGTLEYEPGVVRKTRDLFGQGARNEWGHAQVRQRVLGDIRLERASTLE